MQQLAASSSGVALCTSIDCRQLARVQHTIKGHRLSPYCPRPSLTFEASTRCRVSRASHRGKTNKSPNYTRDIFHPPTLRVSAGPKAGRCGGKWRAVLAGQTGQGAGGVDLTTPLGAIKNQIMWCGKQGRGRARARGLALLPALPLGI